MDMKEKFEVEGNVTHISRRHARVKFDGLDWKDTFITVLELEHHYEDRDKIVEIIYPDSISIRTRDHIFAGGNETYPEGVNFVGFANGVSVLDRGFFRNKRKTKQSYFCRPYTLDRQ